MSEPDKITSQLKIKHCVCCDSHLFTVSTIHYLFDDDGLKLDLSNLLNYFLNIEISKEDNEDAAICGICLENLLQYQKDGMKKNENLASGETNLIQNYINVENLQYYQKIIVKTNDCLKNDETNLTENHINVENLQHHQKGIMKINYSENHINVENLLDHQKSIMKNHKNGSNDNTNLTQNHINADNFQQKGITKKNENLPNSNTNQIQNHTNVKNKPLVDVSNECYNGMIIEYNNIDDLENDNFFDHVIEEDYRISDNDEDDNNVKVINDCDSNKIKIYNTSFKLFIDSIDKVNIKKRLTRGISCRSGKLVNENYVNMNDKDNQSTIDLNAAVQSIYTSEDLINILEGDYNRDTDTVSKEKLTTETFDFDQYLSTIINVLYDDLQPFPSTAFCALCKAIDQKSENIKELHNHTFKCHSINGANFMCILDALCGSFDSVEALNNHLFIMHSNVIKPKISLTCKICNETFSKAVKFGKHMCFVDKSTILDKTPKTYQCQMCLKSYLSHERFLFHEQFHLPLCRPKVCIICEQLFVDDIQYYEHVQFTHELIAEYGCKLCDKSFINDSEQKEHNKLYHTNIRIHTCSECNHTFQSIINLNEHKFIHVEDNKKPECDFCQRKFKRKAILLKHLLKVHVTKNNSSANSAFICNHCECVFKTNTDAVAHTNLCSSTEPNTNENSIKNCSLKTVFLCEFCEKSFCTRQALINHHVCKHTDDKEYKCAYCPASFNTYTKLITHKNIHKTTIIDESNQSSIERRFICIYGSCKRSFTFMSELSRHRKTVHLEFPTIFKCSECTEIFNTIWSLTYHKKSVHKLPIQCVDCKVLFTNNASYKRHNCSSTQLRLQDETVRNQQQKTNNITEEYHKYIINTKEYPFYCHTCKKSFSNGVAARTHVRYKHIKERNFKCDLCDESYFSKRDLKNHSESNHSDGKLFSCQLCPYKNKLEKSLKDHLRSHIAVDLNFKHQCQYCLKFWRSKNLLKVHIAERHRHNLQMTEK